MGLGSADDKAGENRVDTSDAAFLKDNTQLASNTK